MKKEPKSSNKKIALLIMRIQPLHNGHTQLIYKALMENDKVIVILGSSQEKRTKRNPFSTPERMNMLKQVFGDSSKLKVMALRDIGATTKQCWVNYVFNEIKNQSLEQPTRYYAGDEDNAQWFDTNNPITNEKLDVLKVDRLKTGIMSATEIRNSIYNGFDSWKDHTPTCLINMIEEKYPKDLINPMNLSKEEWEKRNV